MNTDKKKAVLINYGLMLSDVYAEIQDKANFISRFFQQEPELAKDPDLITVGRYFGELCKALQEMNNALDRVQRQ